MASIFEVLVVGESSYDGRERRTIYRGASAPSLDELTSIVVDYATHGAYSDDASDESAVYPNLHIFNIRRFSEDLDADGLYLYSRFNRDSPVDHSWGSWVALIEFSLNWRYGQPREVLSERLFRFFPNQDLAEIPDDGRDFASIYDELYPH